MKLTIRPIQGEFCAEVIGANLARPMDDATFTEIERAWTRHSILVFRDVRMSAEQHSAFEGLDAGTRKTIMGRRACFSRVRLHHVHYPHLPALTEDDKRKRPDVWHPITRRHPKSGWTALYVGRWACEVEGMPDADGAAMIQYLQEFAVRPEFIYRHRWRAGDAVLWDNRCAQHCATPFDDEKYRRHMHRTTIEGETPLMATSPAFRSSSLATQ